MLSIKVILYTIDTYYGIRKDFVFYYNQTFC